MNWLTLTPLALAGIAFCSAIVAVWNARTAIKNADRQFALSYINDVNKWATDVMTTFRKANELFGGPYNGGKTHKEKGLRCNEIIRELFHYKNLGFFLFPANTAIPQLWLDKMISAIFSFQDRLWTNENLSGEDVKLETGLREGFVEAVREELQVGKRYNDAKRYLK